MISESPVDGVKEKIPSHSYHPRWLCVGQIEHYLWIQNPGILQQCVLGKMILLPSFRDDAMATLCRQAEQRGHILKYE